MDRALVCRSAPFTVGRGVARYVALTKLGMANFVKLAPFKQKIMVAVALWRGSVR